MKEKITVLRPEIIRAYQIFELSSDADLNALKVAHHRLVKLHHDTLYSTNTTKEAKSAAVEEMKKINNARDILTDHLTEKEGLKKPQHIKSPHAGLQDWRDALNEFENSVNFDRKKAELAKDLSQAEKECLEQLNFIQRKYAPDYPSPANPNYFDQRIGSILGVNLGFGGEISRQIEIIKAKIGDVFGFLNGAKNIQQLQGIDLNLSGVRKEIKNLQVEIEKAEQLFFDQHVALALFGKKVSFEYFLRSNIPMEELHEAWLLHLKIFYFREFLNTSFPGNSKKVDQHLSNYLEGKMPEKSQLSVEKCLNELAKSRTLNKPLELNKTQKNLMEGLRISNKNQRQNTKGKPGIESVIKTILKKVITHFS